MSTLGNDSRGRPLRLAPAYGSYVVEEVLARGGQGVVVRAQHPMQRVPVAIKILTSSDAIARGRFLREVQTLARLRHPNLPAAIDVGEQDGVPWIAIEFIDGKSLRDVVKERGLPEDVWCAETLAKIARALAYCHDQGVLHRDMKPDNIVIQNGSSRPVLVDFGLAKVDLAQAGGPSEEAVQRLSMTGDFMGTPAYMAPEQATSDEFGPVSPRTDVYGLGGVLYTLLTGEKPFDGTALYNVILRIIQDPSPDPQLKNPKCSEALADICRRAMAKEPGDRYTSAEDMARDLDLFAHGGARADVRQGNSTPLLVMGVLLMLALAVGISLGVALFLEPRSGSGSEVATSPRPSATPTPNATKSGPGTAARTPTPPPIASPSTSPSLALGPEPGVAPVTLNERLLWVKTVEGLRGARARGPYVVVHQNPQGEREQQRALLLRADGSPAGTLKWGGSWVWDEPRKRLLVLRASSITVITPAPKGEDFERATLKLEAELHRLSPDRAHLYAVTEDDRFVALDPESGAIRWTLPLPAPVTSPPLPLDLDADGETDHLLLATADGALLEVDPRRGVELRRTSLPAALHHTPLRLGPVEKGEVPVLLTSVSGALFRVRVSAGEAPKVVASADLGLPLAFAPCLNREPDQRPTTIYAVSWGSEVRGLDLSLQGGWETHFNLGGKPPSWALSATPLDLDGDGSRELHLTFDVKTPTRQPFAQVEALLNEHMEMLHHRLIEQPGPLPAAWPGHGFLSFQTGDPRLEHIQLRPKTTPLPRFAGARRSYSAKPHQAPEPPPSVGWSSARLLPLDHPWPGFRTRKKKFFAREGSLSLTRPQTREGPGIQVLRGQIRIPRTGGLRLRFEAKRAGTYTLRLEAGSHGQRRRRAAEMAIAVDGRWVVPHRALGVIRTMNVSLGALEAGRHEVELRALKRNVTYFVLRQLKVFPKDELSDVLAHEEKDRAAAQERTDRRNRRRAREGKGK